MKITVKVRSLVLTLATLTMPVFAETLAVVNGTLIDGTGSDPVKRGVVLIDDGRITAVGSKSVVTIPSDAKVIDAKGKYVIPGLMDANLHLYLNLDVESLVKYEDRYDEVILEAAQIALKTGQTTVFDTWGPRAALVKARDSINRGEAPGSRIFLAGNIIGFDGLFSPDFLGATQPLLTKAFINRTNETWQQGVGRELMWMGPEEVAERVAEYAAKEVNFLKYGGSGHTDMFFISFSPRVQQAIVSEGHKAGMTVQTHTSSLESFDMAIEAGVDIITHCDISGPKASFPKSYVQKMVDRGIACSVLPITDARMKALEETPNPLTDYMRNSRENIRTMIEAGATLMLSTDAGIENPVQAAELPAGFKTDSRTKLGEGHFNALLAFEELGMAPMEILKSVTSNVAKSYKMDDQFGTLETGKFADIVILDKNPLKSAKNYRAIHKVIKEGKVIDIESLPINPLISNLKVDAQEK